MEKGRQEPLTWQANRDLSLSGLFHWELLLLVYFVFSFLVCQILQLKFFISFLRAVADCWGLGAACGMEAGMAK